jgi:CRISPR-associated protein Cmr5
MNGKTSDSKPTLDQRRARHAWEAVCAIVKKYSTEKAKAKKIGGQAKKLPMRIIASGLGQALAFLKAKDYAPDLLIELSDWVLDKRSSPDSKKPKPVDDALIQAIINGQSDFLRRATDEALSYLLWFNRFAEAENLTEEA